MYRCGFGYDSHRFAPGRPLVLGGVRIEHELGLGGHSAADPQWKDAASGMFVRAAVERARSAGYAVANADLTVITESPRLKAHKPAIRSSIATLLGVEESQVNVKAKTNEHMGWIGRGEGLAALATVMLCKEREHE